MIGASIRFAITDILAKALPYGLLALSSALLQPEYFVQISIAVSLINILSSFVAFGSKELCTSAFSKLDHKNWSEYTESVTGLTLVGAIFSIVIAIPLFLTLETAPLSNWWFWITCIISSLVMSNIQLSQVSLSLNQSYSLASNQKIIAILPLTLGISASLAVPFLPIEAFSLTTLITSTAIGYHAQRHLWKRTLKNFIRRSILNNQSILIGLLYGTSSLLGVGFSYAGQFILAEIGEKNSAAIFSLCTLLLMISMIISNSVNQTLTPHILKKISQLRLNQSKNNVFPKYFNFISKVTGATIAGTSILMYYISDKIWSEYNPRQIITSLAILGCGFIFNHISYLYRLDLHSKGKDFRVASFTILTTSISCLILFAITNITPTYGAIIGTATGYLLIGLVATALLYRSDVSGALQLLSGSISTLTLLSSSQFLVLSKLPQLSIIAFVALAILTVTAYIKLINCLNADFNGNKIYDEAIKPT